MEQVFQRRGKRQRFFADLAVFFRLSPVCVVQRLRRRNNVADPAQVLRAGEVHVVADERGPAGNINPAHDMDAGVFRVLCAPARP